MKRVYAEAFAVIVWLGDAEGESDRAMDIVAQIADIQTKISAQEALSPRAVDFIQQW
jgi:hypothetical protein